MTIIDFFHQYKPTTYKKHEIILHPNDDIQSIYYMDEGFIRMYADTPDGKELTLNIFKPDSYFPLSCILFNSVNKYYYQSHTNATVFKAPINNFLDLLKKSPIELFVLTKRIVSGLDGYLVHTQHLLFGNAKKRIASTIILYALRFGEKIGLYSYKFNIMLTHQDFGNITALTRETCSIEIEKLINEKIISYESRKIFIPDIRRLYTITGENSLPFADPNIY